MASDLAAEPAPALGDGTSAYLERVEAVAAVMMVRDRRLSWLLMVLAVVGAFVVISCQPFIGQAPETRVPGATQRVCDGISSDVGGCDPRHSFTTTTCGTLAEEWGLEMDRRIVPILQDPTQDPNQAASVLLRQALVVVTSDMNTRLRSLNLAQDCEVEAFLSAAEPHLSDELKASVGDLLFDGSPRATYEEWLEDVRLVLRMIEEE